MGSPKRYQQDSYEDEQLFNKPSTIATSKRNKQREKRPNLKREVEAALEEHEELSKADDVPEEFYEIEFQPESDPEKEAPYYDHWVWDDNSYDWDD